MAIARPAGVHPRMPPLPRLGAVNLGGTHARWAVGDAAGALLATGAVPTTTPDDTLGRLIDGLRSVDGPLRGVVVGSFGPVDRAAGVVLPSTPKPGWGGAPVGPPLAAALGAPVRVETDVTVEAVGEHALGAARGTRLSVYLTVGTGVGAGLCLDGAPLPGLLHPEVGHLPLVPHPDDLPDLGPCGGPHAPHPCLEGLAAGPAWRARRARGLPDAHIEALVAGYLVQALIAGVAWLSPEVVVLGGGVTVAHPGLVPRVADGLAGYWRGYVPVPRVVAAALVDPDGGARSGLVGALILAGRSWP